MKLMNKHGGINEHTGKGNDRMGGPEDGLGFEWRWVQIRELSLCPADDTRRVPCQTCWARAGKIPQPEHDQEVIVEVVAWGKSGGGMEYEPVLIFGGRHGDRVGRGERKRTRVGAQRAAEHLLRDVGQALLDLWKKAGEKGGG